MAPLVGVMCKFLSPCREIYPLHSSLTWDPLSDPILGVTLHSPVLLGFPHPEAALLGGLLESCLRPTSILFGPWESRVCLACQTGNASSLLLARLYLPTLPLKKAWGADQRAQHTTNLCPKSVTPVPAGPSNTVSGALGGPLSLWRGTPTSALP